MSHTLLHHPSDQIAGPLDAAVYEAMYQIFANICSFWQNLDTPENYRSQLYTFMDNRMKLRPEYRQYYQLAKITMAEQVQQLGEAKAYEQLFTDSRLKEKHNNQPLAITRQKVSNEFVTFQLNQGGFKAFGATNSTGYISGAFIPGKPVPYRPLEG
jgi:hypothetical protein